MRNFVIYIVLFFTCTQLAWGSSKSITYNDRDLDYESNTSTWPFSIWPGMPMEVFKSYVWMQEMQLTNGLVESAENTNFISLYDNSLAALVFMAQGEIHRAEKIFDFFNARLESEFKANGGGFFQFRNALGEGGERIWMGDNAWLLIAVNHYHTLTGSNRYQQLAEAIDTWLREIQKGNGGLKGGKEADGSAIPEVTEGMITAFIAVKGYDKFHSKLLRYLKRNRWDEQNKLLMSWPENSHYRYALDLHSLGSLIFSSFPKEALYDAGRFYTTQKHYSGEGSVSGFCFDEDRDVVWYEGTAQMALAYKRFGLKKQAAFLLGELQKGMVNSQFNGALGGLPYSSGSGTSYGSSKLWDHADKRAALSSNAWFYFAYNNFNPLDNGAAKIIPEEDQFWLH